MILALAFIVGFIVGQPIWSMLNITASLINVLQYIIVGWELNVSMAGSYGEC